MYTKKIPIKMIQLFTYGFFASLSPRQLMIRWGPKLVEVKGRWRWLSKIQYLNLNPLEAYTKIVCE